MTSKTPDAMRGVNGPQGGDWSEDKALKALKEGLLKHGAAFVWQLREQCDGAMRKFGLKRGDVLRINLEGETVADAEVEAVNPKALGWDRYGGDEEESAEERARWQAADGHIRVCVCGLHEAGEAAETWFDLPYVQKGNRYAIDWTTMELARA